MALQAIEAAGSAREDLSLREYIGAMALQLAQMARAEGDEALGRLLDSAAYLADHGMMASTGPGANRQGRAP